MASFSCLDIFELVMSVLYFPDLEKDVGKLVNSLWLSEKTFRQVRIHARELVTVGSRTVRPIIQFWCLQFIMLWIPTRIAKD